MTPFETVYRYATDKCPQLAPKNTFIVHEWIKTGYDPELDILPAIENACRKGTGTIMSFAYFDGFIRTQHEKRLKSESQAPIQHDRERLLRYRSRGIPLSKDQTKYLEASEPIVL